MMVGVPGSGKSTAIKALLKEMPHLKSVSTDEYLEKIAKEKGKSYNEVHGDHIEAATKSMNAQIQSFIKNKQDFIWDQTNVVQSARLKKMKNLTSNGYDVTAITFELSPEELQKRLKKRVDDGGKHISAKIVENMLKDYTRPDYSEGFDSIILIGDNGASLELKNEAKKMTI
jgi:predicted ABC-type ATPase